MSSLVPSPTVSDVIPGLPAIPPVDYSSRDYQSILNDLITLIPTYLPEWTDRSPGDFGIVLAELFAYMGDILNYYIDRIANEAFMATAQQRQSILNLANLLDYTPHGNVAATTQPQSGLQFTISQPHADPVTVKAGTQVATQMGGGLDNMIFETTQDLIIWGDGPSPPPQLSFVSNGQASQKYVIAGPYDGLHQTVTVNNAAWTQASGNTFSTAAATDHVYIVVTGNTIEFGDGVHGFVPPTGQTIVITYLPAAPNTYTALVPAIHGVSINGEIVGQSSGLPSQRFTLFRTPIVDGSISIFVDEGNGPKPWVYYQRMVDAFSTDLAFTTSTDANGIVTVMFGDGITGRIPIAGAGITTNYRVGGGAVGNLAANTLTVLSSAVTDVISVSNPLPTVGGADAETLDHIRIHAPLSISAINRAVTLDDYAALILNVPTIAKASASATYYNAVNLYIHPTGDFFSDPGTLTARVNSLIPGITNSAMTGFLDDKKMATVSIQVIPPQYNKNGVLQTGYVPVDVTVSVQVLDQYHQQAVQAAVQAAVSNLFLFSVVDFGYRIRLSALYHTVQEVEGVDWCIVNVLCRDEVVPQVVGDVICAPYEIPQLNPNGLSIATAGGVLYPVLTATTLVSSVNPSAVGQSVTFTATVSPGQSGAGPLTGSVTFSDGATVLVSVPLSLGQASYTTSSLTAGTHSITAAYGGSGGEFVPSTSAPLSQTVH